jgi:thiamine biosynthesis lipoprotein
MKQVRLLMDMPITVDIVDTGVSVSNIDRIFDYFTAIDNRFSTYKKNSEISLFNSGKLPYHQLSPDMKYILDSAEETKKITHGYFDIHKPGGLMDPSGIVKGWAIYTASTMIEKIGFDNYYVDAGGDIQVKGHNSKLQPWKIGIRNPMNRNQHVKILSIGNRGIATSGTSIRGQHIYDPFHPNEPITEIVSVTVIGPNVYEADRFATAAFAMRDDGLLFIASLKGFEGYTINRKGIAMFTPDFETYVVKNV